MKKTSFLLLALTGLLLLVSCRDSETYAEKKKRERAVINQYIADKKVNVISEEQFLSQDTTTDLSKNQFVLFNSSGVYMQIVRRGTGKVLGPNETATALLKYTEVNMMTDSVISSNNIMRYSALVDVMKVKMISGSPFAQFESGVFMSTYRTPKVPNGLLAPLTYIRLGKLSAEGVAKVRLIVPSAQGTAVASGAVYPCLYELTYQRGR